MKTGALTLDSNSKVDATSYILEIEDTRAPAIPTTGNTVCTVSDGQDCDEEMGEDSDGTAPDVVSVEESAVDGTVSDEEGGGSNIVDDEDLLDLLVDTLDVEFDPSLIVA